MNKLQMMFIAGRISGMQDIRDDLFKNHIGEVAQPNPIDMHGVIENMLETEFSELKQFIRQDQNNE